MSIHDLEFLAGKLSANSVSIGDWEKLVHFARDKETVVELGTNTGSTSLVLSHCSKKVHTVDVFEGLHLIEDMVQQQNYTNHFNVNQNYHSKISIRLSHRKNVVVYKNLSYKLADRFLSGTVDLIFIDADHSYKGVEKDYNAWFDRVKVGGFFAFHDVGEGCEVLDFFNNVLLADKRIELQHYDVLGPCCTEVFKKL